MTSDKDRVGKSKFSHLRRILDPVVTSSPQVGFDPLQVLRQLDVPVAVGNKNS